MGTSCGGTDDQSGSTVDGCKFETRVTSAHWNSFVVRTERLMADATGVYVRVYSEAVYMHIDQIRKSFTGCL